MLLASSAPVPTLARFSAPSSPRPGYVRDATHRVRAYPHLCVPELHGPNKISEMNIELLARLHARKDYAKREEKLVTNSGIKTQKLMENTMNNQSTGR